MIFVESQHIAVLQVLRTLDRALANLHSETRPATGSQRFRKFCLGVVRRVPIMLRTDRPTVCIEFGQKTLAEMPRVCTEFGSKTLGETTAAEQLCRWLGYQPRLVLRAIRRLEAATVWAIDRRAGKIVQAGYILAAQSDHQSQIDAMAAMQILSNGREQ